MVHSVLTQRQTFLGFFTRHILSPVPRWCSELGVTWRQTLILVIISGLQVFGWQRTSFADDSHQVTKKTESENQVREPEERILVKGQRQNQARLDRDATGKVEILQSGELKRYGAQSLADAIKQSRGVDTQTFCANCGAKRVTINGLRGEHTTILIDGVPLHSAVSSFYGVDAVPIVGVDRIEVRRGSGSALTTAEAIGGVIDLYTVMPQRNGLEFSYEASDHGAFQKTALTQVASDEGGAVLAIQEGQMQPWDLDHNGVAESPFRATRSGMLKLKRTWGDDHDLSLRLSAADLEIIGGNPDRKKPVRYTPIQAQPSDFRNGDVREAYIGAWERITDHIQLRRQEAVAQYVGRLPRDQEWRLRLSRVEQNLDAIYSHGFDYENQDAINGFGFQYSTLTTDGSHLLTFGLEERSQTMNTASQALFVDRTPPLVPDRLRFKARALTLLDEWRPMNLSLRADIALRVEEVQVEWLDLKKEIRTQVVLPRVDLRYDHTGHVSSRLSVGRGYRPPLTLFESEHGSDHNGFLVDIQNLEEAESGVYSFSANYTDWFITVSTHITRLNHMAYADKKVPKGQPLVFRNSEESFSILAHDLYFGGNLIPQLFWQVSYEQFDYTDAYTRKLPTAMIEQRARLEVAYDTPEWSLGFQATAVGARRLSRYGYDAHYNRYDLDVMSPTFGQVSVQKPQRAPGFWDVALSGRVRIDDHYAFTARVNNLFDFTQTAVGDSPTTWHWHVNHAHYDNFHTWGPLAGREYFVGFTGQW
jgi:outer membrane receptor for ferrienterochelin and colicins